jgi:fimbrial isopeptide formation D2 family protein
MNMFHFSWPLGWLQQVTFYMAFPTMNIMLMMGKLRKPLNILVYPMAPIASCCPQMIMSMLFRIIMPFTDQLNLYPTHNIFPETVYHDEIPDCVEDTLDVGLQYWKVKVEGHDYLRIKTTNAEGKFKFSVPKGDYSISAQPVNSNWDLCEESYPVSVNENQISTQQDFLAHALSSCSTLDLDFSTPFLRRCFDNTYYFTVRNTGPGASVGTELTLHLDPYFEFISASIPYTLVGDSIVKFELGALEVNEHVSFQMNVYVSCDAVLGQEHCMTGILSDNNSCGNDRSSYTECQQNIGSNDPNDKRTFNAAGNETDRIEKGEYIYYHIRFQNTGTDTAFKVKILDPLSDKLDFSTLEILSASHPYDYVITDGPALSVTFDHILLPDSSINEAASPGFIKFRVKPLPQYDYGTQIPNQASIYFDFNQPVITNEATMMIQHGVGNHRSKGSYAI